MHLLDEVIAVEEDWTAGLRRSQNAQVSAIAFSFRFPVNGRRRRRCFAPHFDLNHERRNRGHYHDRTGQPINRHRFAGASPE
ncbi:hypothetical protein [Mycolicibacterium sp.]|uniref:hypothetical protein n=1 Tax=Mycolicibacterium sp. TaxID=2320850 RepID=UPI0037CC6EDF